MSGENMKDAKGAPVEPGDLVQIDPTYDQLFGGNFMVVEDVYAWGFQGYVLSLEKPGRVAYYRCPKDKCVRIGCAGWRLQS